jgi:hypothetical protein
MLVVDAKGCQNVIGKIRVCMNEESRLAKGAPTGPFWLQHDSRDSRVQIPPKTVTIMDEKADGGQNPNTMFKQGKMYAMIMERRRWGVHRRVVHNRRQRRRMMMNLSDGPSTRPAAAITTSR